ncbi:MAG: 4Fe-4S binding protein [Chloroflexi bacterium]|nr:4Fe-4S binding protein [Chloroflexota bacterium]
MIPELEQPIQAIARPAIKKRAQHDTWSRFRFVTTVSAIVLIALGAATNVNIGTFSSFSLGPVTIACPLGVAQIMAATQSFIPALALAGLAGVLLTILFGRAFCGWLCPGRWLFNHSPRMAKQGWKHRAWVQSGVITGVVGLAWVFHNPVFCIICPVGSICRGAVALGGGGSILPALGWLSALLSVEWFSGRSWCRDLCPVGATLSRISALNPFVKVKADSEKCRPCLACMKKCPESVNLSQATEMSTCTKCFACQGVCPRDAVEIKLINK